ncbi:hypothetical protein [Sphingomonas sp.]|uniref:hypothetical protein n=1 Tax=Sphingomonas sp. TaxID=28214 RepID=UPI003B3A85D7
MHRSTGYGLPYPNGDLPAAKRVELYLAQLDAAAAKSKAHKAAQAEPVRKAAA